MSKSKKKNIVEEEFLREGFLWLKKPDGGLLKKGGWKKREIKLQWVSEALHIGYFKGGKAEQALVITPETAVKIVQIKKGSPTEHTFEVQAFLADEGVRRAGGKETTWRFAAENQEDKQNWMETLRKAFQEPEDEKKADEEEPQDLDVANDREQETDRQSVASHDQETDEKSVASHVKPMADDQRSASWVSHDSDVTTSRPLQGRQILQTYEPEGDLDTSHRSMMRLNGKQKEKKLWKMYKDPDTGRSYYYNRLSKETTWQIPDNINECVATELLRRDSGGSFVSSLPTLGTEEGSKADTLEPEGFQILASKPAKHRDGIAQAPGAKQERPTRPGTDPALIALRPEEKPQVAPGLDEEAGAVTTPRDQTAKSREQNPWSSPDRARAAQSQMDLLGADMPITCLRDKENKRALNSKTSITPKSADNLGPAGASEMNTSASVFNPIQTTPTGVNRNLFNGYEGQRQDTQVIGASPESPTSEMVFQSGLRRHKPTKTLGGVTSSPPTPPLSMGHIIQGGTPENRRNLEPAITSTPESHLVEPTSARNIFTPQLEITDILSASSNQSVVAQLREDNARLGETCADLEHQVSVLIGMANQLNQSLEEQEQESKAKVDSLSKQVKDLEDNLIRKGAQQKSEELESNHARVSELEKNLSDLKDQLATASVKEKVLLKQFGNLQNGENLDYADEIAELEKKNRSLQEQLKTMVERMRIEEDKEMALMKQQQVHLKNSWEALNQEHEKLKVERDQLNKKGQCLEAELATLKQRNIELLSTSSDRAELQRKVISLEQDRAALMEQNEELKALETQIQTLQNKISGLLESLTSAQDEKTLLLSESENLRDKVAALEQTISEERAAWDTKFTSQEKEWQQKNSEAAANMNKAVDKLQAEKNKSQATVIELESKILSLEKEASELKAKLKAMEGGKHELEDRCAAYEVEIESLNKQILTCNEEIKSALSSSSDQVKGLVEQKKAMEQRNAELLDNLDDLKVEVATHTEAISDLNRQNAILETKNSELKAKLKAAKEERNVTKQNLSQQLDQIDKLKLQVSDLKGEVDSKNNSADITTCRIQELNKEKKQLKNSLAECKRILLDHQAKKEASQQQVQELKEQVVALESDLDRVKSKLEDTSREKDNLRQVTFQKEKDLNSMTETLECHKREMELLRSNAGSSASATVQQAKEVARLQFELEKLTNDLQGAQEAEAKLKEDSRTEAILKQKETNAQMKEYKAQVSQLQSDLHSAEAKLQEALQREASLQQEIDTTSSNLHQEADKKEKSQVQKIDQLQSKMIALENQLEEAKRHEGELVKDAHESSIQKVKEIEQLTKTHKQQVKEQTDTFHKEMHQLEEQLATFKQKALEAAEVLSESELRSNQAQAELNGAKSSISMFEDQIASTEKQNQSLSNEVLLLKAQKRADDEAFGTMKGRIACLESNIVLVSEQEKKSSTELGEARRKMAELEVKVSSLEAHKKRADETSRDLKAQIAAALHEKNEVSADKEDLEAQLNELQAEMEEMQTQLQSSKADCKRHSQQVQRLERELKAAEGLRSGLEMELSAMKSEGKEPDCENENSLLERLNAELRTLKKESMEQKRELVLLRQRKQEAEVETEMMTSRNKGLEEDLVAEAQRSQDLITEKSKLEMDVSKARHHSHELETKLNRLQLEIEASKSMQSEVQDMVKSLKDELSDARSQSETLQEKITAKVQESAKLSSTISMLQDEVNRLQAENRDTKQKLIETKQERDKLFNNINKLTVEKEALKGDQNAKLFDIQKSTEITEHLQKSLADAESALKLVRQENSQLQNDIQGKAWKLDELLGQSQNDKNRRELLEVEGESFKKQMRLHILQITKDLSDALNGEFIGPKEDMLIGNEVMGCQRLQQGVGRLIDRTKELSKIVEIEKQQLQNQQQGFEKQILDLHSQGQDFVRKHKALDDEKHKLEADIKVERQRCKAEADDAIALALQQFDEERQQHKEMEAKLFKELEAFQRQISELESLNVEANKENDNLRGRIEKLISETAASDKSKDALTKGVNILQQKHDVAVKKIKQLEKEKEEMKEAFSREKSSFEKELWTERARANSMRSEMRHLKNKKGLSTEVSSPNQTDASSYIAESRDLKPSTLQTGKDKPVRTRSRLDLQVSRLREEAARARSRSRSGAEDVHSTPQAYSHSTHTRQDELDFKTPDIAGGVFRHAPEVRNPEIPGVSRDRASRETERIIQRLKGESERNWRK